MKTLSMAFFNWEKDIYKREYSTNEISDYNLTCTMSNKSFLPDPGVSGVRSMGPGVCLYVRSGAL